jgi:glycosyltransferase involved in cell wall biosynthesis
MTVATTDRSARADVIVPTFNNLTELQRCLASLATQAGPFRVLVCVDGSTDGTVQWLRRMATPFELLVLQHADAQNHGRAAARNLALPHLREQVTVLLDSDMRLRPSALRHHVALVDGSDVVSVGAVVYENADQNPWARYLATRGRGKVRPGSTVRPLDFVTANAALRTEHLQALGGFDASMAAYGGEDTELALRLAEGGLRFLFNGAAVADTTENKTIDEGLAELGRYARTNLRTTRRRHPSGPAPFWIDRLESRRWRDRLLRLALNPVSDRIVDSLLPRVPFVLQRQLLNYKVIRTVFRAYAQATR